MLKLFLSFSLINLRCPAPSSRVGRKEYGGAPLDQKKECKHGLDEKRPLAAGGNLHWALSKQEENPRIGGNVPREDAGCRLSQNDRSG